jgi:hypothetical protein
MLSFPAAIKVYLCTVACDMRRSFEARWRFMRLTCSFHDASSTRRVIVF